MRASEPGPIAAPQVPRWLLIGNSRWHWAAPGADGPAPLAWHTVPGPPAFAAPDSAAVDLACLWGWAAVGAVPEALPLPEAARIEIGRAHV